MKRFTPKEQMAEAYLGDYPRLDEDFYNGFEQFLRGKGFRLLGDVCVKTPGMGKAILRNTVCRCMCDASGCVMAAAYQVGFTRWRRWLTRLAGVRCDRVIEFRALGSDQIWLAVNVEASAFQRKAIANAHIVYQPSPCNTPVAAMYANWIKAVAFHAARPEAAGQRLYKLNTLALQRSAMEYEDERGIRLMRTGKLLSIDEFSHCECIYFEPSEMMLGDLDRRQRATKE